MARSYLPSKVSEIVALWRKDLVKVNFVLLLIIIASLSFQLYALANIIMEKMVALKLYVDSRSHNEEIRRKYLEMGYLVILF